MDDAIQEAKAAGTYDLPVDLGDRLLAKERTDPLALSGLREEGIRDEDIRWWWNMTEVGRLVMKRSDSATRLGAFAELVRDRGLDPVAAGRALRKILVMYGDPSVDSVATGEDRNLPYELRQRVTEFFTQDRVGANKAARQFSSLNAFVRDRIRNGLL